MGHQNNLVVLRGTVNAEPSLRELRTGEVLQFDLSTRLDDGAAVSVPVSWHDPTATQRASFGKDDAVVVVGTVRRRFFRAGGQTQSRTEVIVEALVPARRRKSARSAVAAAVADLTAGGE